jgi:predicted ATP-grasp superfamily ATP-dependent carboligase
MMRVLVTDASGNHALAVVRSLGRRGIDVIAADGVRCAQASFSRYAGGRAVYPSPRRGVAPFQEGLLRLIETRRPGLLLPMTECTLTALAPIREAIESAVRLAPLPEPAALATAFDKRATIDLAASLRVRAPRTWQIDYPAHLAGLKDRVPYPVVIKPRASELLTDDGRVVASGPVAYAESPDALEAKWLAVHRRAPRPLIQEFIPGEGYGISTLYDRGRLRALFAHRRLRMIIPTGSGSSLRESILPPRDMADAACRLLEALHWHGVAMVEFKRDARDGTAVLMEINGRFWNSLPLAVASGVDFPFLLYRLATEGACPESFDYRVGVRGRWLAGDAAHLVAALRGRPPGWTGAFPTRAGAIRNFLHFGGRDLHYDDLWLSDPVPFAAGLVGGVLRHLPGPAPAPRPARAAPLWSAEGEK